MELIIGALVGVIGLCYLAEVLIAPVDWAAAGVGLMTPALPDSFALTIAVGIIGATVMPHAIYLHSGLMQSRAPNRATTRIAASCCASRISRWCWPSPLPGWSTWPW